MWDEFEKKRQQMERSYRQNNDQLDKKREEEARKKFIEKKGLIESIKEIIYPNLVTIRTINGVVGIGYFHTPQWLVSNAHIISCAEMIDSTKLIDHEKNTFDLVAEASFHRPSQNDSSPDVVIIKNNSRNGNEKIPSIQIFHSKDEPHEESYIFYLSPDLNNPGNYEIKYLKCVSKEGKYPHVYECQDSSIPQSGCLGSPIIRAEVILGREPKWRFTVVGVLYSRCNSTWIKSHSEFKIEMRNISTKFVCAIPVEQEFSQLLEDVHYYEDEAKNADEKSNAAYNLGDEQGISDAKMYAKSAQFSQEFAKIGKKKFEAGMTELNISLPEGLEKLWYKDRVVVPIEFSLLIEKVRKRELGQKNYKNEKFMHLPSLTAEELKDDFCEFLKKISEIEFLVLSAMNNFLQSPKGHFRLDIIGGSKSDWVLEIQDNTDYLSHEKQPLSSIFAKVKLPITNKSINGEILSKSFSNSQKDREQKDPSSLKKEPIISNQLMNKQSKKISTKFYKQIIEEDLKQKLNDALISLIEEFELEEAKRNSLKDQRTGLKEALAQCASIYEFDCVDVKPDGSCFFHAISDQLLSQGYGVDAAQLREMAIDHILNNLSLYNELTCDIDAFIISLLGKNEWADHVLIQALSRALQISIVIIKSNGETKVFRRENSVATLYVGYEVNLHYQSLRPNANFKMEMINNLIESELDIDNKKVNNPENLAAFVTGNDPSTSNSSSTLTATTTLNSNSASSHNISNTNSMAGLTGESMASIWSHKQQKTPSCWKKSYAIAEGDSGNNDSNKPTSGMKKF